MAGGLPDLVARVRLDTTDLDGAVGRATKVGAGIGSAIGGLASQGIGAAVSGIKSFATGAVDAFARVEDATGAAGVQFGSALPQVLKFADSAATSFGISSGAAIDAANTFGTLGKSAGLSGGDLAGFSTKFTGLAADLASFKGTSPEQAIEAVGAALRGEAEPIRAYGVLLDDASLRQEALAQGLISTTKDALTPQQKVLATQALLLKQTGDAQGDFARTSDSTANTQKRLAAETENAQAALGAKLAPALTLAREGFLGMVKGASGFIDALTPVMSAAVEAVEVFVGALKFGGKGEFDGYLGVINDIGATISEDVLPAVQALVGGFTDLVGRIPTPVFVIAAAALGGVALAMGATAVASGLAAAATGAFAGVMAVLASPVVLIVAALAAAGAAMYLLYQRSETVRTGVDALVQFLRGAAASALTYFAGLWPSIQVAVATAMTAVQSVVQTVLGVVQALWQTFGGTVLAFVRSTFGNIRTVISGVLQVIRGLISTVLGVITGDWRQAWDGLKTVVSGVFTVLRGLVQQGGAVIKGLLSAAWEAAKAVTSAAWEALKRAVQTGVDGAVAFVKALPGKASSALSTLGSGISGVAGAAMRALGSAISGGISAVVSIVASIPGKAVSALSGIGSALTGAGGRLMDGLAAGIRDRISAVVDTVRSGLQRIKNMLPGSPIKDGPLTGWNNGGAGKRLMQTLTDGVQAGTPGFVNAMADAAQAVDGVVTAPDLGGGSTGTGTGAGGPDDLDSKAGAVPSWTDEDRERLAAIGVLLTTNSTAELTELRALKAAQVAQLANDRASTAALLGAFRTLGVQNSTNTQHLLRALAESAARQERATLAAVDRATTAARKG